MPNSFSRFLSDAELAQVRELYEESLSEFEQQPETEELEAELRKAMSEGPVEAESEPPTSEGA